MNINFEKMGRIVCSALLYNNCIYMSKKGHYDIFPMEPIGVLKNATQGFVTENGYFVDRKVALSIAMYFDQIDKKYPPLDMLMSEDLKKENLIVLNYNKNNRYRSAQNEEKNYNN